MNIVLKGCASVAAIFLWAGMASAVTAPTATCQKTAQVNQNKQVSVTYDLKTNVTDDCFYIAVGTAGSSGVKGNDNSNADFQTAIANANLSFITKVNANGSLDSGEAGYQSSLADFVDGTFSNIDLSSLSKAVIVFKAGDSFAAFSVDTMSGLINGSWSVVANVISGNGDYGTGLSHVSLYGSTAAVPVPAAGLMLVGALGGLGALRRRRKTAA